MDVEFMTSYITLLRLLSSSIEKVMHVWMLDVISWPAWGLLIDTASASGLQGIQQNICTHSQEEQPTYPLDQGADTEGTSAPDLHQSHHAGKLPYPPDSLWKKWLPVVVIFMKRTQAGNEHDCPWYSDSYQSSQGNYTSPALDATSYLFCGLAVCLETPCVAICSRTENLQ